MSEHLRYDFPAISDIEDQGQAGDTTKEIVYEDHPRWKEGERGQRIGTVNLKYTAGKKMVARFTFENKTKEKVTYEGDVPDDGSGKGKGRVRFQRGSGTGKFKDRNNEIDVEFHNPKRWG